MSIPTTLPQLHVQLFPTRVQIQHQIHLHREHQLPTHQWRALLPQVMHRLNHTPVKSLGNRSPAQVFAGIPPRSPVALALTETEPPTLKPLDFTSKNIKENMDNLASALQHSQQAVNTEHERNTADIKARHSQKPNIKSPTYEIGTWVLVKKSSKGRKNDPQWSFARIVGQTTPTHKQLYRVKFESVFEDRRTEADIHIKRLVPFGAKTYQRTPELDSLIDYSEDKRYNVENFENLRLNNKSQQLEILVKWERYETPEWQPFLDIHSQLPVHVNNFLANGTVNPKLVHRAHEILAMSTSAPTATASAPAPTVRRSARREKA